MSRKAISVRVLKKVVKDCGEVFTTKDVSEDPRVMQAHRKLADAAQADGVSLNQWIVAALASALGVEKFKGES